MAAGLGVTYQAIRKWESAGRLPRTEWTGETDHAAKIARMTGSKVSRRDLLKRHDIGRHPELTTPQPPATPSRERVVNG